MTPTSLSIEFQKSATKVYTFGFIAFGVKYMTVEFVMLNGVRVPLADRSLLIGALGVLCGVLTIVLIITLLRDLLRLKISDAVQMNDESLPLGTDFSDERFTKTLAVKRYTQIMWLSRISFAIEGVAPILFGVATSIVVSQDIYKMLTSAFG